MSIRLHFVVEGQTEETFVNHVLAPHLAPGDVFADARCVYTAKNGVYWSRGGVSKYAKIRKDILNWTKQDLGTDVQFTTMFDLYRLPHDFPGQPFAAKAPNAHRRAEIILRSRCPHFGEWLSRLEALPSRRAESTLKEGVQLDES